jgi:hypothetical protein
MAKKGINENSTTALMAFLGMGFELCALMIGAIYFGGFIDRHYGWNGYSVMGLICLSFFGWVVHIVVLLKNLQDAVDDEP